MREVRQEASEEMDTARAQLLSSSAFKACAAGRFWNWERASCPHGGMVYVHACLAAQVEQGKGPSLPMPGGRNCESLLACIHLVLIRSLYEDSPACSEAPRQTVRTSVYHGTDVRDA